MADVQSNEKDIFIKHYASLCSILTNVDSLLRYFVQENIISTNDVEEINAITTVPKKVEKLLSHISGPLTAGDVKGFHTMLTIIKQHGNQSTKDLAERISHELTLATNKTEDKVVISRSQESPDISCQQASSPASVTAGSERSTVITADSLSVQFSTFVTTITTLLSARCSDKLEQCKQLCSNLTISDNLDKLLFNDTELQKINACSKFSELFAILRNYWSYTNYSILSEIITITDLKEAKEELELFKTRMASYEGMKILSQHIPPKAISLEYIRLKVIIDKSYRQLTLEDFIKLRDFIFEHLDIKHYTALPHIKFLLGSLHLEWYVLKKAAPYMIKMAKQNEEVFMSNSVVFIQVDQSVVLDSATKDTSQKDDYKRTSLHSSYKGGGYDNTFVDAPPDRLVCKICHLPCREAQQSECCGNIYCKDDIDRLKATTSLHLECHTCHAEDFVTYPNLAIDHEIQQLMVQCPDKEDSGCNWVGRLKDLDRHYSYGREYETECEKNKTAVKHRLLHSHTAEQCCKKNVKLNDSAILSQLYIRSYLTIAVVIIAILIALLLQLYYNISEMQQQITLLQDQITKLQEVQQYDHQMSSSVWSTKLWMSSELSDKVAPTIVKMSKFTKKLKDKEEWYSSPFFAFEGGYQMCLNVHAAGYDVGEGTHVSVYLFLMKGPHDNKLEQSGHWPLRGIFTIELLNQLNDSDHHIYKIQMHHYNCRRCTNRITETTQAYGFGHPQFISHDTLLYNSNNSYYKSGFLMFRISYEHMEAPYQVAPITVNITNFSYWLESKTDWHSSPFFAFEKGYLLFLHTIAAGNGVGEGTHVSLFLNLVNGPHDDKLEQSGHWPMRGTFTIELLNQLNESDHHICMVQFHHHRCSECTERVRRNVIKTQANNELGTQTFISHDTLLHNSNNSYHKSDILIFRISYEHMETPYQVAPITVKMTKFSYWLKSMNKWDSSPFFAFEGGYQMCLRVYPAGNGVGEGTHVSVFLALMKGPHDDKLEQSGHWPLRGTFTIELLNQLNDSDHHICMVQLHCHLCSECTKRVRHNVIQANNELGAQKFISHDTLLHHSNNSYYKSDFLIFRISYKHIEAPYQVAPITVKITKFSYLLESMNEWDSSPFFAFEGGYQMCLRVYPAGNGVGEGTHVSVFLALIKGPHDDELEQSGHWPMRGTFTIELLNQLNDSDRHICMVQFHHHRCSECTKRVQGIIKTQANIGLGTQTFISHDTLLHNSNDSNHKSDFLIFRISYEHMETPYQVAPITVKMTKFSYWLEGMNKWHSSPFFAFKGGYQMCLQVYPAGNGVGEGNHMSVFLALMKGPHDNKLEQSGHWPLRGTFTIELLNQHNDSNHHSLIVQFHDLLCDKCTNRVLDEVMTDGGLGSQKFISYLTLYNSTYIKENSLLFRISYESVEPPDQIAPVTFKLTRFSLWSTRDNTWYSSPFLAFNGGYQMCLKVDATGYFTGIIKGTRLLVYLCLMKGPHDDNLEQSGHWPMKGTFTIELLNQFNDSNHYSFTIHCTDSDFRRVKVDKSIEIHVMPLIISHNTLFQLNDYLKDDMPLVLSQDVRFQHNGYLKDDILNFRISYSVNSDGCKGN